MQILCTRKAPVRGQLAFYSGFQRFGVVLIVVVLSVPFWLAWVVRWLQKSFRIPQISHQGQVNEF